MIEISHGAAIDVAAIMPVMRTAFDPEFGEAWTAAQCTATLVLPGSHLLIARCEGQVAGFALSRTAADEEELLLIAVAPPFRRRHIAARLLQSMIANARARGSARLFLEMREANPAIFLYGSKGFEAVGRRPNYYSGHANQKYDAITMAIAL